MLNSIRMAFGVKHEGLVVPEWRSVDLTSPFAAICNNLAGNAHGHIWRRIAVRQMPEGSHHYAYCSHFRRYPLKIFAETLDLMVAVTFLYMEEGD